MEMEQRGEQSISLSMSRIAEMTTSAVTNRVKGGQIKRDGKERTHGHKQSNGADFVKVFPVGNFGPSYIKAVRAPLSNVKMLAVGGINEKNIKEYLDVGICGFGIGSNIVDKKMLENDDYEGITNLTKKFFDSLGE